jgi:hypothetical protein
MGDLESESEPLCPYGLKSSVQNLNVMLCMPVCHGALAQE